MNANNGREKKSDKHEQSTNGPFGCVHEALLAVRPEQWRMLAQFAQFLLDRIRSDSNLARYLAGVEGEEIVNSTVLSLQLGEAHQNGRKATTQHLADDKVFLGFLKSTIRSVVDNYRRHKAATIPHEPIGYDDANPSFCDPSDPIDLDTNLAIRDLLKVVLPRVLRDLEGKPAQIAVFNAYVDGFCSDDILPAAGQSKFVRHCVREAFRKVLKELVTAELQIENPTGREILSKTKGKVRTTKARQNFSH